MQPNSLITASSSDYAPSDQFDALRRTQFRPTRLLDLTDASHNSGAMQWQASIGHGSQASFGLFAGAAIKTRRYARTTPDAPDAVIVTWLRSGHLVQETSSGAQSRVQAGDLYVYDTTQPMDFHCGALDDAFLMLPRNLVSEALGGTQSHLRIDKLPATAHSLAPFLQAQLSLLHQHGAGLSAVALTTAIDAATSLALTCLREAAGLATHGADNSPDAYAPGLLVAARQVMRTRLHQHDLQVEQIAQAVHTSRAQLYRSFAEQGSSVYAELREMRLQAARQHLERSVEPISTISWRCGFSTPGTFSRVFRTRFGAPPQEWRAEQAAAPFS